MAMDFTIARGPRPHRRRVQEMQTHSNRAALLRYPCGDGLGPCDRDALRPLLSHLFGGRCPRSIDCRRCERRAKNPNIRGLFACCAIAISPGNAPALTHNPSKRMIRMNG